MLTASIYVAVCPYIFAYASAALLSDLYVARKFFGTAPACCGSSDRIAAAGGTALWGTRVDVERRPLPLLPTRRCSHAEHALSLAVLLIS